MSAEDYIAMDYDPEYDEQRDFIYTTPRNKFNRKINPMKNNKMNKYYVGASHIADAIANNGNSAWTSESEKDAIEHAKNLMESEDRDIAIIVKITHIIRRGKMPISVERVK